MKKELTITLALLLITSVSFAANIYEKADDNTLRVTSTSIRETNIEYGNLVKVKNEYSEALDNLTIQYADELARMQLILDELNKQVTEAGKLGIVEKPKPVEPIIIEEE